MVYRREEGLDDLGRHPKIQVLLHGAEMVPVSRSLWI